jgi:glycosyltransferase involved in cell wall biosynthesis
VIVALDMQLGVGHATGIGEYVRGLAPALRACGIGVIELYEEKLDPWRFDRRVAWDQVILPQRARASNADILHCASGTMPLRVSMPTVVTVHDVAWLKVQRHTRPYARYYFGTFSLQRYSHASAIVVDSKFSRNELLEATQLPPDNVFVVYPGVASEFCTLARRYDGAHTILVPGTVERRKNLEVLIRALPMLPGDVRMICVGPSTPYRDECERLAEQLGVATCVEFLGYVPREQLLDLYASAALVAVPSRYEGFGYAAAQALCAATPLVVSDASSLPEVVQRGAAIAPVDSEEDWRREILGIFSNPGAAQARADKQRAAATARFAWPASARSMRQVYETALKNPR